MPSKPHQYEFARLNLTYTLLSKRVLTQLVRDGHVAGWDDPRMPTIAGLKRRACRRRRSANSSSASGWPRPTAWSMSACWNSRSAKLSNQSFSVIRNVTTSSICSAVNTGLPLKFAATQRPGHRSGNTMGA